ncbi:MAG: SH3 domain-containing protein [Lachnospiraceae bacterium]|nr:SH3 domain-containing protein [Lachnospiraceae bacterium]
MKDKMRAVLDFIMRKSKIVFPVIVIAAVAVTVVIALNANDKKGEQMESLAEGMSTEDVSPTSEPEVTLEYKDIPLVANEDPAIYSLVATYYNAQALGDMDTLTSICDTIALEDMIRFQETAKYLESYPVLEIYTKPGFTQGSTIAYVYYKVVFAGREEECPGVKTLYICTDEQGELFIKNDVLGEEEDQYIKTLSTQADVVELFNRVNVEYNDLMVAQPKMLEYLSELNNELSKVIGVLLAEQIAGEETQNGDVPPVTDTVPEPSTEPEVPVIVYAKATTTVNVRSSDSINADKLGKAKEGMKLQVLEQLPNGWNKVLFENKEGYIKADYLQILENVDNLQIIGTVIATTNINVRAEASKTSTKLGILIAGDAAELLAHEGEWCKIKYNGEIGYVKAEYVE